MILFLGAIAMEEETHGPCLEIAGVGMAETLKIRWRLLSDLPLPVLFADGRSHSVIMVGSSVFLSMIIGKHPAEDGYAK